MKQELINQYKKNIPKELQDSPQWIVFQKVPRTNRHGETKISKVPLSALTLSGRDWNSKDKWASFEQALSVLVNERVDGLAFVLSSADPFVCIDLDHCLEHDSLTITAKSIIETFPDSYMELSQSKQGVHIFLKGSVPKNLNNQSKGIEIYQENHCIAMTGDIDSKHLKGSTKILEYDKELNQLYQDYAPKTVVRAVFDTPATGGALPSVDSIIETMCRYNRRAKNLFQGTNSSGDWSKDDFSLLLFLNSFTHGNAELMKEVFLKSALNRMGDASKRKSEKAYLRYLDSSIDKAIQVGNKNYWDYHRLKNKGGLALE